MSSVPELVESFLEANNLGPSTQTCEDVMFKLLDQIEVLAKDPKNDQLAESLAPWFDDPVGTVNQAIEDMKNDGRPRWSAAEKRARTVQAQNN